MDFNDFYWHDAIIKNIYIDRKNPGKIDEIHLEIEWPEESNISDFVFEEVYWAKFSLNFGIVAKESILSAVELKDNDEDLIKFYLKWKGVMSQVKLKAYMINLNSTGGEIKIISKGFRVGPLSQQN